MKLSFGGILSDLSETLEVDSSHSPVEISADVYCAKCGYNLRGLTWAGLCPECATPTEQSRWSITLSNTNPDWVGKVRRGVVYLLVAFGLNLLGFMPFLSIAYFRGVLFIIATVVYMIGAFRITSKNTDLRQTSPAPVLRIIVRICAVVDAISPIGLVRGGLPFALTLVSWVGGFIARVLYLIFLLRLLDDAILRMRLTRQLIIVMLGLTASSAIGALIVVAGAMSGLMFGGGGGAADMGVAIAAGAFALAFAIWYAVLLWRIAAILSPAVRGVSTQPSGVAQPSIPSGWIPSRDAGAFLKNEPLSWAFLAIACASCFQAAAAPLFRFGGMITFPGGVMTAAYAISSALEWGGAIVLCMRSRFIAKPGVPILLLCSVFVGAGVTLFQWLTPWLQSAFNPTFYSMATATFLLCGIARLALCRILWLFAIRIDDEFLTTGSMLMLVGNVTVMAAAFLAGLLADVYPGRAMIGGLMRGGDTAAMRVLILVSGEFAGWGQMALEAGMVVLLIHFAMRLRMPTDDEESVQTNCSQSSGPNPA